MKIRKAQILDVLNIQKLIKSYADKDEMLPRSLNELYENIRDFVVIENKNGIIGTAALHILWEDLAEIKSVAVKREYSKRGLGKKLVRYCLKEARKLGVKKIFVLTYVPDYFKKFGFVQVTNKKLPQKVWNECIKCVKFPECGEVPLVLKI